MPLTPKDVALLALPYVKKCISEANDIGLIAKILSKPFLLTLTRMGIEIAVALTAPKLLPVLEYLLQILPLIPDKYLAGIDKNFILSFLQLLQTPKSEMHKAVQSNFASLDNIAHVKTMSPEDLAALIRNIRSDGNE